MNRFRYVLTSSAKNDLMKIRDYLCYELYNQKASDDLARKFYSAFKRIEAQPFSCPRFDHSEYRKLVIDNYVAFYKTDEEQKLVIIHRVIYGGRNLLDYI